MQHLIKAFIFIVFFYLNFHLICAQNTVLSKDEKQVNLEIDKLVQEQFKANEPGGAVLVAKKGKIVYQKAAGMANLELNIPLTTQSIFRIGSISKQFTTVAILQLYEQGKLDLQDEITKYIEDYPTQDYKITIEHLMTHTSGIKSYTGMKEWDATLRRKDFKPLELIDFFKNQPMEFAPGTKWNYNNSAYILLGYIIEKVSGKTYEQYISESIFKPLGMSNSYYGNVNPIIKNRAAGYEKNENSFANASYLSMTQPYAAGSLLSTVEDLFKWNQALHSFKVLKKETLAKAFTSYKLKNGKDTHYGYGWFFNILQGSPTIEHSGGINGFTCNGIYLPNEEVYTIVLTNCEWGVAGSLANKIAATSIGKPLIFKEITLSEAILKSYTGVYENEAGEQRTISFEEGKLYSMRAGGNKIHIKPYENNKFFVENSATASEFVKDKDNKVIKLIIGLDTWQKTDKPIPSQQEIKVDDKILEKYIGDYELAPNFVLSITKEQNKMMAQATGQGKNEIFAESNTKFFLKVVDAKIEFFKDETDKITKLILYQGGQKIEGKKIK